MSKRTRQQTVSEIVAELRPPNQAALAAELERRGFSVTQATLSRDIAELGLVKSKNGYLRPEDAPQSAKSLAGDPRGTLRRLVVKVTAAQNLVVIRTAVGGAPSVGLALDDCARPELLGTVAGDDTVLVVIADRKAANAFAAWLHELVG